MLSAMQRMGEGNWSKVANVVSVGSRMCIKENASLGNLGCWSKANKFRLLILFMKLLKIWTKNSYRNSKRKGSRNWLPSVIYNSKMSSPMSRSEAPSFIISATSGTSVFFIAVLSVAVVLAV